MIQIKENQKSKKQKNKHNILSQNRRNAVSLLTIDIRIAGSV